MRWGAAASNATGRLTLSCWCTNGLLGFCWSFLQDFLAYHCEACPSSYLIFGWPKQRNCEAEDWVLLDEINLAPQDCSCQLAHKLMRITFLIISSVLSYFGKPKLITCRRLTRVNHEQNQCQDSRQHSRASMPCWIIDGRHRPPGVDNSTKPTSLGERKRLGAVPNLEHESSTKRSGLSSFFDPYRQPVLQVYLPAIGQTVAAHEGFRFGRHLAMGQNENPWGPQFWVIFHFSNSQ